MDNETDVADQSQSLCLSCLQTAENSLQTDGRPFLESALLVHIDI